MRALLLGALLGIVAACVIDREGGSTSICVGRACPPAGASAPASGVRR